MKYFNPIRSVLIATGFIFSFQYANAQLQRCNVYMQGTHIEVGINYNGAYGSGDTTPPTGYVGTAYHPNGSSSVSTTCGSYTGAPPGGRNLGFVADPDKDGWTVGSPYAYYGDYFLPGSPQEGWSVMADGTQVNNWNSGGTAYGTGAGTNIAYNLNGKYIEGVWQGTWDSIKITQRTLLDTTKVFFTTYISMVNTANVTTRNKIYYLRTVDPDNCQPQTGSFTTRNKIEYQLPNAQNRVMVSATGQGTGGDIAAAYLGLGTLDCRAKCFIIGGTAPRFGLNPVWGTLDSMYGGFGGKGDTADYSYAPDAPDIVQDNGIGLVFKLGDLSPHDSVSFAYAYILRRADIDSAFLSTQPKWTDFGDTTTYLSGDTAAVCKGTYVPMNIVNGGYLSWVWTSPTGALMTSTTGTAISVYVGANPEVLMAVGTAASCTGDTLLITITPTLANPPSVVSPVYYCQMGTPDSLKATGPNLRWYTSDPSDTGRNYAPVPRTDSVADYTYYVTSRVRTCESDRATILVHVNPPPPVLEASNNGALCLDEKLQLTATTIPGSKYYWSGPNGFKSNLQNPFKNNVVAADSGLYTVVDSLQGCPTQVATTSVLVDNLFAKIGTAKNSVCTGDTLMFNFAGHAPDTNSYFTWTFDDGIMVQGDATGKSKGPYIIRFDTSGTKYIKLTAQNWRCVSTVIDTLPVHTAPDVRFNMPKDICIHDTITVLVAEYSLQNANNLAWDFGGGGTIISGDKVSGAYHVSYSTAGQKSVFLTATYPWCIRQPYGYDVNVHELPQATISGVGHGDVCEGDTVTFSAAAYPNYIYTWGPPRQVGKKSQDGTTALITIPQSGNVYVNVRDQYNCKNNDTMYVNAKICCTVSFPSAFTPNGDGRNDVFKAITIGHHHVKHFKVVNRYGQVVFESNDENKGWDGTLFGVPQDMDTYFYVFTYNCNGREMENKGDVILVR